MKKKKKKNRRRKKNNNKPSSIDLLLQILSKKTKLYTPRKLGREEKWPVASTLSKQKRKQQLSFLQVSCRGQSKVAGKGRTEMFVQIFFCKRVKAPIFMGRLRAGFGAYLTLGGGGWAPPLVGVKFETAIVWSLVCEKHVSRHFHRHYPI